MVANTRDEAGIGSGGRRKRRAWGAVEQLPSGRFRARVVGLDGRYVSAPTTFTSRTDAAVWLDLPHADMVRGVWKAPRRSTGPAYTVGKYIARWIEQHPSAKDSTKALYRGLLRGCIEPELGKVRLGALTADTVRAWHFRLGRRLAAAQPSGTSSRLSVGYRVRRPCGMVGPARRMPTGFCGRRWRRRMVTG